MGSTVDSPVQKWEQTDFGSRKNFEPDSENHSLFAEIIGTYLLNRRNAGGVSYVSLVLARRSARRWGQA